VRGSAPWPTLATRPASASPGVDHGRDLLSDGDPGDVAIGDRDPQDKGAGQIGHPQDGLSRLQHFAGLGQPLEDHAASRCDQPRPSTVEGSGVVGRLRGRHSGAAILQPLVADVSLGEEGFVPTQVPTRALQVSLGLGDPGVDRRRIDPGEHLTGRYRVSGVDSE
jgi:hypothetical protein